MLLLVKITESGVEDRTGFSILHRKAHPDPHPPDCQRWPLLRHCEPPFLSTALLHSWTGVTGCSQLEGAHQQSADEVYYVLRSIQSAFNARDRRSRFVAVLQRCSNTSLVAERKIGRVLFCCTSRLRGHRSHPWVVLEFRLKSVVQARRSVQGVRLV
jgi:hypothetical protein